MIYLDNIGKLQTLHPGENSARRIIRNYILVLFYFSFWVGVGGRGQTCKSFSDLLEQGDCSKRSENYIYISNGTQEVKLVENWLIRITYISTLRRVETLGSRRVMAPIPSTIVVTSFVQNGRDTHLFAPGELLHRATGDDQVWMCVNQWIWSSRLLAGCGVFTKTCLNRKRCKTKMCYLHCADILLGVNYSQSTLVFHYERTQPEPHN